MSFVFLLVLVVVLWVVPILICNSFGKKLGFNHAWMWGFFLGWIGVFIIAIKYPFAMTKAVREATGTDGTLASSAAAAATMTKRLMGPDEPSKQCPDCAESVLEAAQVCKHCGHRFETVTSPAELA
jgi:Uncharacterised protein family UPF0547